MKLVPFFSLFLILLNCTAAESTPWKFYRHQSVPEQDASGEADGKNLSAFIRNGKCKAAVNTAELRTGTVFFEFARKQK